MISRASERVAKGHVVVAVAIKARRRGIILYNNSGMISFCSVLGFLFFFFFFFFGVVVGGGW